MTKSLKCIFFLLTSLLAIGANGQTIGLNAENAYISLKLQGPSDISGSRYAGKVVTFDRSRGFLQSSVTGKIQTIGTSNANKKVYLDIDVVEKGRFDSLKTRYLQDIRNRNTAWVREKPCPSCINMLTGTTLRVDPGAEALIGFYEKNRDGRSRTINKYLALKQAQQVLCGQGYRSFCITHDRVGIVMQRPEAGIAKLVASSFGERVEVATFRNPKLDGALVSVGPSVIQAIASSAGPTLKVGDLDFSDWKVVDAAFNEAPSLQVINLSLLGDLRFFSPIVENPRQTKKVGDAMSDFFRQISGSEKYCKYDVFNANAFFVCDVHSDDLGTNHSAWVRVQGMLYIVKSQDTVDVVVSLHFQRKYNNREIEPADKFSPINFGNRDEGFLAKIAKTHVANAFRELFGSEIEIVR